MITVTGIFARRDEAERAIGFLRSVGINDEHLALLARARRTRRWKKP